MTDTLTVDIVTPEAQILSTEADMVVIPGQEGAFGVLPSHAPLISKVRPGVIRLYKNNDLAQQIVIFGGIAEVTGERCTLMASHAYVKKDNTLDSVKTEIATLSSANDEQQADKLSALQQILSDLEEKQH